MKLRRPTSNVLRLGPTQRHRGRKRETLQPVEGFAVDGKRAASEATLDLEVLKMSIDVGVARGRREA